MSNFSIAYQFKAMTGQFQREMKRIKQQMKGLNTQIKAQNISAKRLANSMNKIGKSMTMKVTAPLLAAGTAGIYTFAKLEKGLMNVKGLTDDKTWAKFGGQFKDIQKRAIELGFSVDDVNKSLFSMPSGLGVNEMALKGYNAALKLSIAGDAKLEASTEGIIRIMTGYSDQLDNVEQAASGLFQAQVIGVTNVEKLAINIGKVIANSKLANLSFGTMISTAAGLTKVLPTEQALTAMNALLASLLTPTPDQQKTIKRIWGKMGVKLPVGAAQVQKADFFDVMEKIIKIAKTDPDLLTALIPEQRAVRAMGGMTNEILAQVKAKAKNIDTDIKMVALNKAYNGQLKTAMEQLKRLKGQFTILFSQLGKELFPMLKTFVDKALMPAVKWFKALTPETKKWIVEIGILVAAIGPALIIVGKLITAFIVLKGSIIAISAFMIGGGGLVAGFATLLTTAGLVGAALAGWGIGRLIAQIPIVDRALDYWFGLTTGATAAKKEATRLENLRTARETLIPILKATAQEQGFKGALSKVFLAPKTIGEVEALRGQLQAGKINLPSFTGQSKDEIRGKIVIETRDPQGVVRNVRLEDTQNNGGTTLDMGMNMGSFYAR